MPDVKDRIIDLLADRLALVMCKSNDQAIDAYLDRRDDDGKYWDQYVEALLHADDASRAHQKTWRADPEYENAKGRIRDFLKRELRRSRPRKVT